jgi:hypothetical protein
METEAQLIVQRASLRWLAQRYPTWTQPDLATALGKSLAWVKKWLKRLRDTVGKAVKPHGGASGKQRHGWEPVHPRQARRQCGRH